MELMSRTRADARACEGYKDCFALPRNRNIRETEGHDEKPESDSFQRYLTKEVQGLQQQMLSGREDHVQQGVQLRV